MAESFPRSISTLLKVYDRFNFESLEKIHSTPALSEICQLFQECFPTVKISRNIVKF